MARRRPRNAQCQCTVCDEIFTGGRAFSMHTRGFYKDANGKTKCTPPEVQLNAVGKKMLMSYKKSNGTVWGVWQSPENQARAWCPKES